MNHYVETRHLPPELQELVDTIISGVIALASRTNSNTGSNPVCATNYLQPSYRSLRYKRRNYGQHSLP